MTPLLERSGLVTPDGRVTGAEGPHPDAALLDLIAEYTTLIHTSRKLFHRANQHKDDTRLHKRLWKECLATRPQEQALERQIIATKAHTPLGLIAKMEVWLDLHSDNGGTMLDLPRAALKEAMAMLEGLG